MRSRKTRIALCMLLIAFFLGYQAFGWWLLNDIMHGLVPKEGVDPAWQCRAIPANSCWHVPSYIPCSCSPLWALFF